MFCLRIFCINYNRNGLGVGSRNSQPLTARMGEMGYQVAVVPQSIVTPIPSIGFLSIPAEIRLKIYTIVLTGVSYHILVIKTRSTNKVTSVRCFMPHRIGHSQAPHCSNPYCFDKREAINLSLLRTCRIIYHEASLMHYSGNTFKFSHGPEAYKTFMASRAPVQLRNIQSIEVTSEGPRYGEMKRNDIWHNLCTTIGSMTNLKHLKLALRMVCF